MRLPSKQLIALLEQLQLCSIDDLRSCQPLVKRLAQDLPDFDSVWLDALVQQRVITPWQADVLQSSSPEQIRVGEFTLQAPLDEQSWLATRDGASRRFVVRRICVDDHDAQDRATERLSDLLEQLAQSGGHVPAILSLPERLIVSPDVDSIHVASRCVEGWSGEELLIRGGRLPHAAVAEIGRDLLKALAWLESHRLLHGDVVLRNLRLTSSGSLHLTNAFIRRVLHPHVLLSESTSLRELDGVAPELVGSGRSADIRCDLYAVGCVLWQLLTSRPVVLTADPVARIVRQKQHDIADPRSFVPDCPEWLARQIMSLTRRTPELRPGSAEDALKEWMKYCSAGRSHCRKLVNQLPDRSLRGAFVPGRRNRSGSRLRRFTVSGILMVIAIFVVLNIQSGRLPQVLRLGLPRELDSAADTTLQIVSNVQLAAQAGRTRAFAAPLPAPSADGVIALQAGYYYLATDINSTVPVVIQLTDSGQPAEIIVAAGGTWNIVAATLHLSGVSVHSDSNQPAIAEADAETDRPHAVVEITATDVRVEWCSLSTGGFNGEHSTALLLHPANAAAASVQIHNSVFTGSGNGIWLENPPSKFLLNNVLLATRASAIRADFGDAGFTILNAEFHRVTQRFGFSLFDIVVRNSAVETVQLRTICGECVFDPATALVRFVGPADWETDRFRTEFLLPESGNPAVVDPAVARMIYLDRTLGHLVEAAPEQMVADSLLYSVPEFANATGDGGIRESEIVDFEGPKLSPVLPGIIATELPPAARR
jgi:eukaryotic-like serine/threonine-protein kinase